MSHIFEQNNIAERVQKAIQRFGAEGMKFGVKREKFEAPVDLASDSELAARKRFLLQTSENGEAARVAYEHQNQLAACGFGNQVAACTALGLDF